MGQRGKRSRRSLSYDPSRIIDAPEFHDLSRAMGILTWETWDHGVRPVEERIRDFVAAFPPEDPLRFASGASHAQTEPLPRKDGQPAERFFSATWRAGSLYELLSRYGLKLPDAPPYSCPRFTPGAFREVARRRNAKLRTIHGAVDVEPADMDAAKAEYLDRQERRRAAADVRAAVKRMHEELRDDANGPTSAPP